MKQRVEHLDVAKGITILLVAMFHSNIPSYIPYIIEPLMLIRMPFLFFISGIFFDGK